MKQGKNIVVGVTGSIAAYKSADIIRDLDKKGFKISVVMTKEAENFITPLTLSSLMRGEVFMSLFENKKATEMSHIKLAQEADVLLIAPATANILAKLACGLADDLLTCVVLATKAKILIAPAMNENMYHHPTVKENISKLKSFGYKFIDPVKGDLACGINGDGHIADNNVIVKAVCSVV